MYPFYEKAKEEDETAADELIASMMMKFFEHGIHNLTIGGVLPENGEDASNDLSYITLHIPVSYTHLDVYKRQVRRRHSM